MKLFHDVDLCWTSFYAQGAQRLLFEIHRFLQLETLCVFCLFLDVFVLMHAFLCVVL